MKRRLLEMVLVMEIGIAVLSLPMNVVAYDFTNYKTKQLGEEQ
jgi:hypothetical protein